MVPVGRVFGIVEIHATVGVGMPIVKMPKLVPISGRAPVKSFGTTKSAIAVPSIGRVYQWYQVLPGMIYTSRGRCIPVPYLFAHIMLPGDNRALNDHKVAHVFWVGCVRHRSCTAYDDDRY